MSAASRPKSLAVLAGLFSLAALLALAFWLRWRYVQEISLYVDEFTSLWAARRVLATGAPLMPSGVLYTRGLLASYVTAFAAMLGGLSYTVGRLPSLIFGLATIVAILAAGRREWNVRVGWLAAAGLALLPEAVVWSGRARFYAQLQFFVLLAVWAAYVAVQYRAPEPGPAGTARTAGPTGDPPASLRRHLLFAGLFVLALFSQEQTVLLYPPIILAFVLWRGWRYLLRPQVWPAQVICLLALGLRFALEIVGQPGYFETIQSERPYVGLIFDLPTAWAAYAPLLIAPERLVWTLAALLATAVALWALAHRRWRLSELAPYHQATLFFALQFAFVLAFILTLVGGQWRETRYLFLVQTVWLLVAAAGAIWIVDRLLVRPTWRWAATGLLIVATLVSLWRPVQRVLAQQVEGYDRVLAYVAANRQPGDVTMSPQPPACALVLGPCDYYAVQKVYEEFVVPKNGVLVDRWSGAQLLNSAQKLQDVVRAAPTVWLITDGFRLATRYDADFLRTVTEQFDIAFEERGVMALRARGWRDFPTPVAGAPLDPPVRLGPLALTAWSSSRAHPGQPLDIVLTWQGADPIDRQINTSFRLVNSAGQVVAQQDGPPARGMLPTNLFFATPLPDRKTLTLPVDLAPGPYTIQVVAYDVDTVTPVADPYTVGAITVSPAGN